eukprot:1161332-Pelagomonas_calceolata.AAC.6
MEFLAALSSANFAKAIALVDQQLAAGNEHTSNGSTPMPTCMMARLYMNRAFCKYRLQLYRKAVKEPFVEQGSRCTICGNSCLEQDYDQALQMQPGNMEALYLKGLVLEALKRPEVRQFWKMEARGAWRAALAHASPTAEARLIIEASNALARVGGSIQEVVIPAPDSAASQPPAAAATAAAAAAAAQPTSSPAAAAAAQPTSSPATAAAPPPPPSSSPAAAAAAAAAGHAAGGSPAANVGPAKKRQQVPAKQEQVKEVDCVAAGAAKSKPHTAAVGCYCGCSTQVPADQEQVEEVNCVVAAEAAKGKPHTATVGCYCGCSTQVPAYQEQVEEVNCVVAAGAAKGKPHTAGQQQQRGARVGKESSRGAAPAAASPKVMMQDNPLAIQIAVTQVCSSDWSALLLYT